MARGKINEIAQSTVLMNGKQAADEMKRLGSEADKFAKKKREAFEKNDHNAYKKWDQELKNVNKQMKNMRMETQSVEAVLKNINGASLLEIERAARKATMELKKMGQTEPGYKEKAKQAELLNTKYRDMNKQLRGVTETGKGFFDKMAYGFNKYFTMATGFIAIFSGLAFSAKEWVNGLVGMDDALANVMKTTGLSRKEVRELYTEFGYLNTRTPRKELLLLAEEAGRLGKKTKKEVMTFVEVGNMIQVALGDDLGGQASKSIMEVGKLTNIYQIGQKYGTDFGNSMLKMGSAINEVSANSQAQAPFLIDMLKRMAGVTDQADLAAGSVIGYASALDQLGQTEEVSATALNKVIIDMFANTATYADIAKMSLNDFGKLLQTDSNEALLKFLEGLNGNNSGLTTMVKKFDDLGVDGSRSIQVLAALAGNTALVRKEQALANKALNEGTSLTNEYNIKNNNMAGNLEKIGHAIRKWFVNSELNESLEGIVGWFAKLVEIPIETKLEAEGKEIAVLVGELTNANVSAEDRYLILDKLNQISPDIVKNLNAENLNYEQLAINVAEYNDELVKRIVLSKLTAQEEDLLNKAARRGAVAKEREIDLYQLIYQANIDIASSQGTIEDKVAKTVDYLVKMGASIEEYNKKSDISVDRTGSIVDERSKEQRLLDEIISAQSNRNDLLERQQEIESDVKPIQERIKLFKEILKSDTNSVTSKTESTIIENTDEVVGALDKQVNAYANLKDEIGQLETQLQHLVASNQPVTSTLIHELVKKKTELAEVEKILKSIGTEIASMSMKKATIPIDEIPLQTREDTTPENITNPEVDGKDIVNLQEEWRKSYLSIANSASSSLFEILSNRRQQELDMALSNLDAQMEAELSNKALTEAQKAQIQEKYRKKEEEIKKEAFRKEKAANIARAIINTAVAVTEALPNIPLAIAAGAAGAAEIAVISSQKGYKEGGYTEKDFSDDKAVGIVHANEFVGNALATANPTVRPAFDLINYAQQNGTISNLNLPAAMAASGMMSPANSGAVQNISLDASMMMAAVAEFKAVVKQLQTDGIEAKLIYQSFKRMADKESKAISKTK